jgi:hypothetical protein
MWLAVARKRLPTPFALRTTKPNPTVLSPFVIQLSVRRLERPASRITYEALSFESPRLDRELPKRIWR